MSRLVKVTFQGPWTNYRTPKYQFTGGTSHIMPVEEAGFFQGFPGFLISEIDPHGFTMGDRDMHPYAEPTAEVSQVPPDAMLKD